MTSGYWERFAGTRISRRRALAGAASVGVGAAALGVVGCGAGGGTTGTIDDPDAIVFGWQIPDTTNQAVRGGIHKSFSAVDVTGTLDPFITPSFTTFNVAGVTYEPLLLANQGPGIEPRSDEGRMIIGGVAESYEVSDDARQYTLKLRPNVRFQDVPPVSGRAMDIDDWRTSLERARASSPLLRATLNEQIDSVAFPDGQTMVITLNEPNVAFLRSLTSAAASFYVMPKELNNDPRVAETANIGSNLRVLERIQPAVGRDYRKHVQYWRGEPFMDGWAVPIIPEYAQQYAQFVTGNTMAFTPRQTDVLLMRNDVPNARMIRGEPAGSYRIQFFGHRDFNTSPWRDDRVRKAMRMSVDWDAVREQFDNRNEFEAAGISVESRMPSHVKAGGNSYLYWLDPKSDAFGPNRRFLLYDLQEARQLMSAAGHPNGIEMDGYMNGGPEYGLAVYPEVVQVTVDEWARSGLFRVRVQRPPYSEYLPRIYQQKDFSGISVQHPEFPYNEVDSELFNWYHSRGARSKTPPVNDTELDNMIMRQRREIDDDRRTQVIHDIQRYMADKMWILPGDGVSGGFGFQQPWLMNTAHPGHLHWIAADAPRRDQA
jgi:ABC-type transport system substrate-binding protein